MCSGLIYKTTKIINTYPLWDSNPSHLCGRQLLYPLYYHRSQYTYFMTAQDITLITIAQNNFVAALYCVPVVLLTLGL